ncbi:MAG: hypothetical protein ABJH01_09000 [Algoriphagus sp.]|uniref:hypothetical protein n=1 Tax=Algoriphagus sp. TaxID=1872435 RepID=UPI003296BF55
MATIDNQANAVEVVISGSTTVCPNTTVTYTVNTYQIPFGYEVNCSSIVWNVYKGIEIVGAGNGSSFSYVFEDIGNYEN